MGSDTKIHEDKSTVVAKARSADPLPPLEVTLRRFPSPFRAMLAICSDLDETPDRTVYGEISRFLNTTETTVMGPGVELEVGNTIYFDMAPGKFSYWNTDDAGRSMIRTLIHSGHIDCLHSFGDLATKRSHAERALDELARLDRSLEIWIDHAVAPTNFGADIMCGHGDDRGHEAYHADLTCAYGIQYVWKGRVSSIIGQDVAPSTAGVFTVRHPMGSTRTVLKESMKRWAAKLSSTKYAMHGPNRVMHEARLRDGRRVLEFMRCNPSWGGVSHADTARGLGSVLTDRFLDRLVDRQGVCVLYTHLGKVNDPSRPFVERTIAALRALSARYLRGELLVLTTRRLLGYLLARDSITWETIRTDDGIVIDVNVPAGPTGSAFRIAASDLSGLSFAVPAGAKCSINVNGRRRNDAVATSPDRRGRCTVCLPLKRLEFPCSY